MYLHQQLFSEITPHTKYFLCVENIYFDLLVSSDVKYVVFLHGSESNVSTLGHTDTPSYWHPGTLAHRCNTTPAHNHTGAPPQRHTGITPTFNMEGDIADASAHQCAGVPVWWLLLQTFHIFHADNLGCQCDSVLLSHNYEQHSNEG